MPSPRAGSPSAPQRWVTLPTPSADLDRLMAHVSLCKIHEVEPHWRSRVSRLGQRAPPTAVPGDQRGRLRRPPGRRLVEGNRARVFGPVAEDGVDDAPRSPHFIRADEQCRIADERVEDDPLVGVGGLLVEALV